MLFQVIKFKYYNVRSCNNVYNALLTLQNQNKGEKKMATKIDKKKLAAEIEGYIDQINDIVTQNPEKALPAYAFL